MPLALDPRFRGGDGEILTDTPNTHLVDYLLSAAAVRERCAIVLAAAERGETRHFRLVAERLDDAVERVVAVTRRRYPDLAVPLHSRWRHFGAGDINRAALVAPAIANAVAQLTGKRLRQLPMLPDRVKAGSSA